MRRMEKDNSGFSIVELIIVIAIIAAIITTAALSVGLVFSANARTCANDIMGAISECKIATMSAGRGNVRVLLYRDASGNIFSELQTRESESAGWVTGNDGAEKIGARRCAVGTTDGGDDLPQRDNAWEIYFNRSSGSFLENLDSGATATNVWEIYVQGGSKNYHIHLERLTGKATLELIAAP
ncbi:MAG: prepilin-type N-terminal cleavage/methylation domain-containing protein [Lachnospiraceae bacterium]|nr:prepilin-type N-terminal cleavage/methylation domain-containing protein [Lachnospiraceae bacterium]